MFFFKFQYNPEFVLVCAGFDAAEGDRIVNFNLLFYIKNRFCLFRVGENYQIVLILK
jgi:hypothetical protein